MRISVQGRMIKDTELEPVISELIKNYADKVVQDFDIDPDTELYVGGLNIYFDLYDSTGDLVEFAGHTSKDIFCKIKLPNKKRTEVPQKKSKKPDLKVVGK